MSRVVFLLEEPSMSVLLEDLLPRLIPDLSFQCVPHEGKQDLVKSVPRKLRAWREPGVRFVVVMDNDGADCQALKQRLVDLCAESGRGDSMVRIVCQELEAWYLGAPEALALAYDDVRLNRTLSRPIYRNPDTVPQPSRVLQRLVPAFQKLSGARRMAPHLNRDNNRSRSFHVFVEGVERIARPGGA